MTKRWLAVGISGSEFNHELYGKRVCANSIVIDEGVIVHPVSISYERSKSYLDVKESGQFSDYNNYRFNDNMVIHNLIDSRKFLIHYVPHGENNIKNIQSISTNALRWYVKSITYDNGILGAYQVGFATVEGNADWKDAYDRTERRFRFIRGGSETCDDCGLIAERTLISRDYGRSWELFKLNMLKEEVNN